MWLVANPLRTRAGVLGAVLTVWRRRRTLPEDFQALDQVAAQTAVALEHAQLHTAAEKERARLDLILEEIPDTVWIVDANARLVRTNSAGRRLLGLAPDDPLPPLAELTPCLDGPDGEDRALGRKDLGLESALHGRTVTGALCSFRRTEGDPESWLLTSAAPLRDHDQRVIGAVSVATDITERRRSEEMLRLLAAASNTLVASLDHRATLTAMAGLTVPSLGDWCVIDLLEDDQTVVRLPVAHADPSQRETASELRRLGPDPSTLAAALAGVQEPAIRDAPEAPLVTMLREEERTGMLRALRLRACMIVPLVARGRKVGLMQFAMSRPGRGYHPDPQAERGREGQARACRLAACIARATRARHDLDRDPPPRTRPGPRAARGRGHRPERPRAAGTHERAARSRRDHAWQGGARATLHRPGRAGACLR